MVWGQRAGGLAPGLVLLAGLVPVGAAAQSFESDVRPLVETSCTACHGARTVTPLAIGSLGFGLSSPPGRAGPADG